MWKKFTNWLKVFWLYVVRNKTCGMCARYTQLNPDGCSGWCDRGILFPAKHRCAWEIPCVMFKEKCE